MIRRYFWKVGCNWIVVLVVQFLCGCSQSTEARTIPQTLSHNRSVRECQIIEVKKRKRKKNIYCRVFEVPAPYQKKKNVQCNIEVAGMTN
jgi:hypothetical protein